jgi:DUF971 family protein
MSAVRPPLALSVSAQALTLHHEDGPTSIAAADLRAACRCAPCRAARLRGEPAPIDAGVALVEALPVGHYAVQLRFSDGHDRGIYPWDWLQELAHPFAAR